MRPMRIQVCKHLLVVAGLIAASLTLQADESQPIDSAADVRQANSDSPIDSLPTPVAEGAQDVHFFETRIRAALIEHCQGCHSQATEASGGLLLDSRQGWLSGGDSGPAIQPGSADHSLLMRAVRYNDPKLQMPPDGKLPEHIIADFQHWIDTGAADPRMADGIVSQPSALSVDQAHQHWAYRPLPAAESFSVGFDLPLGEAVDFFVDQQLASAGLQPLGAAAPSVLLRRLCFDLHGLPPSLEQLRRIDEADAQGQSTAMIEQIIDELLGSDLYGETIARRWMDVVRYADSITLRGFILPQAWRYRDYLIDSFNADRSFQYMIRQQIAGDLLATEDIHLRSQHLVATTMLAMGNTNLEQQDKLQLEMDYLDEQLDVIGSAFLGQTLGCARCHDHKFDPIPTRDYYALAGILRSSSGLVHANVSEWIERPLPLDAAEQQRFDELDAEEKKLRDTVKQLKRRMEATTAEPSGFIVIDKLPGIVIDNQQARLVGQWTSSTHVRPIVGQEYIHDSDAQKGEKSATFQPEMLPAGRYEVRLAYQAGGNRASRVIVKVASADGEFDVEINQQQPASESGLWRSLGVYRFEQNGQAYVLVSNTDTRGHVVLDAVQFLPVRDIDGLVVASSTDKAGTVDPVAAKSANDTSLSKSLPRSGERSYQDLAEASDLSAELKATEQRLAKVQSQLQLRPKYLTVVENRQADDLPIHIRGDVHNLGKVVPRGFLTAIQSPEFATRAAPPNRLDLANWIADEHNPLTARVYVNRVWSWLMGQGLVASLNNFGTTGAAPSHPELLDWLAVKFIQSGWSTKSLVREIVHSQAYRRAAVGAETTASIQGQNVDPDGRWYWRGYSRRIHAEALRDAMLLVSGELDFARGGSLIQASAKTDYDYIHQSTRRSVYQPVFRNSLPPLFEAFDFADPSVSVGQRSRSTVANQGLILMNSPWVRKRAQQAARRYVDRAAEVGTLAAVAELHLACVGRPADPQERLLAAELLQVAETNTEQQLERWTQWIHALMSSLDFRFVE
ncbi:MAG: DUF1553 domain-containing protein [Pirellulaceae bacterium]|nr:DUF1553 domain-containing protein [Pirellulaceae bacterium]